MTPPTPVLFTVCNMAYLAKALTLAESLFDSNALVLNIVVIDAKPAQKPVAHPYANILYIEDFAVPGFAALAFQYDIIELSTALKPHLAMHFLTHSAPEGEINSPDYKPTVIFLDPDTYVQGPISVILDELGTHSVLLTPHYTRPQPRTATESDLAMSRFGSFNLGFFAVRHCDEGFDFLRWWDARCRDFCFMESQFGLSTDQKWVAIAPCFFPNLKVSFHLGLNAAPWNSFERRLSKTANGYLLNDQFPLVFYHFSNFDPTDLDYQNKRASCEAPGADAVLHGLATQYLAATLAKTVPKTRYAYDYFATGDYISPSLRRAYYAMKDDFATQDPFNSPEIHAFAKKNRLLQRHNTPYKLVGFRSVGRKPVSVRLLFGLMRLVLRLFGPNKFFDFGRLLVFLSLYWRNKDLWRL
jgi:hypothetical protein